MQKYINNVQDTFGNAVAAVTVTIRDNPGGGLSSIFSDNSGTVKGNPFTNDTDGEFFFYAANGRYDVELTGPITETKSDIRLLDIISTDTSIRVLTDIVTATPPTTEAVTGAFEIWDADETDRLLSFGYTGSAVLRLRNYMRGAAFQISTDDASGNEKALFFGDPDGAASIYYAGIKRLATESSGNVLVHGDGNTDTENRKLSFAYQNGGIRGFVGHNGDDVLTVRNQVHGGNVSLVGENNSGTVRNILIGDPDAGTDTYYAGIRRWRTLAAGQVALQSDTNTNTEDRHIQFQHQNATLVGRIGFVATDQLFILNDISGGSVVIRAKDAGATQRTILDGDPDGVTTLRADTDLHLQVTAGSHNAIQCISGGAVTFYYNNQLNLRTSNEAAADIGMGAEVRHNDDAFYPVGMNVIPINSTLDGGNDTLANDLVGKMLKYNSATARSLFFNNDANIKVGATWALLVGPSAGVLTGDGGTGVNIRWWNGTGWTTTATAGNITIGVGQYTIWKDTDTLYWISGPTLS